VLLCYNLKQRLFYGDLTKAQNKSTDSLQNAERCVLYDVPQPHRKN
jgi:hypothetical protein